MSDSEQCSNRLELCLISVLVNFSCKLGQIMTRYDFLCAIRVILSNVRTDLNFNFFGNFSCELGQIMTRYDFIWARWVILINVSNRLELCLISVLVNFSCKLGQIITRYDFLCAMRDSEQCSNRLELDLISRLVNFSCELGANNDQIWLHMG